MLKRLSFSFFIAILLLGTACSSNQKEQNQIIDPTDQVLATEVIQFVEMEPTDIKQAPTASATTKPTLTATASATPIPPTETPLPTSTPEPTLTPTPRPITHANIGWEGYDTEVRDPFPDEIRIKREIVALNQNTPMFNSITEEDIRTVWYEADDGTVFWYPFFTVNNDSIGNDLYLYIYSLTPDSDGNLELTHFSRTLNVSALERLGLIQDLTNIKLLWNERTNQPALAIEKNGLQFWHPGELIQNLVSYDQNLSAVGIPEMPESEDDFVAVLFAPYPQDVYLFPYDETATASAGIGKPNDGPVYKLVNNQWQLVDPPEFIGGGTPRYAYISNTTAEDGQLYVTEFTNFQTDLAIPLNTAVTPLAPAAIKYDAALDYYFLLAVPVWSPNGQYIAFITEENGEYLLAVYDMKAQTWQSLTQIPQNTSTFYGPIWSPDGKWLTYSASDTIGSVSFPEGQNYYIGQGCNPTWFEHEGKLAIQFNPNCYNNYVETSRPDGSETGIEQLIYRSSMYENIIRYNPDREAFLMALSSEEDGSETLLYKSINGDEDVVLGELPSIENVDWDVYSGLLFSPDEKWISIPLRQHKGNIDEIVGLYVQNLETKEEYIYEDSLGIYLGRSVTGWTPDSNGLVAHGGIAIYDATTGEPVYGARENFNFVMSPWNKTGMLSWVDMP